MELARTILTLQHRQAVARVEATRVRFSAHQCWARDDGDDDRRCLRLLADHLQAAPGLAVCVHDGEFLHYLLRHAPDLRATSAASFRSTALRTAPTPKASPWSGRTRCRRR